MAHRVLDPLTRLTDEVILHEIRQNDRVIDLGCGDGRLLKRLQDEKACSGMGVELDLNKVLGAVARGVPVVQADLDAGLPDFPELAFDFAVLSQTLQEVHRPKDLLSEMLRVARQAIVVVPNFGHWRVRREILLFGRAPMTEQFPHKWYETPNLHVLSLHDFRELTEQLGIRIVKEVLFIRQRAVQRAWASNIRAESALYVVERLPA